MRTCFGFIFWGALLIGLDFKLPEFDVVPNFVGGLGCALLAIGTGGLAPMTGNFIAACTLGWLLFFAIVGRPYLSSDAQLPFGVLMAVLNCAMMWTTLGGVRDIAVGRSRPHVAELATPLQWAYVAVVASSWMVSEFVMPTNTARVLTVVIVGAVLAVMVMILLLLYRAWKQLSP
jgi:hypothetical protein